MKISNLILKNFRNFKDFEVEFSLEKTLLVGPNGSGKSNILEAVYFLATGDAVKAQREEEIIRFGMDFAKVIGMSTKNGQKELELDLTVTLSPEKRIVKTAKINGVKKFLNQFVGEFKAVEFNPVNINLVTGSPDVRRRYLNLVLTQTGREYRENLGSYEKIRKQKNCLLGQIQAGLAGVADLEIWNEKLLESGAKIQRRRLEYFEFLKKNVEKVVFKYLNSEFSRERLLAFREREVAAGTSLIGPHRDDFEFFGCLDGPQNRNIALYGSRGQQRMAVFELKMGEIGYFEHQSGEEPVLLLDDIFSELDKEHRQEVLRRIHTSQVIFTAAEEHAVNRNDLEEMKVIRL